MGGGGSIASAGTGTRWPSSVVEVEPGSTNESELWFPPTGYGTLLEPVARPDTQWILVNHRNMGGVHSKHRVSVSNCERS